MKLLPKEYYLSDDVVFLAKDLIGKILLSTQNGIVTSGRIVETEAYKAPEDKASHAFGNRYTERTKTFFLEGGHSYVYLCYGIHNLFNVITADQGIPHAILIRALHPLDGIETMLNRRSMQRLDSRITKGPGSLSQALGIDKRDNAIKLYQRNSNIQILDDGYASNDRLIINTPRIGVESAGDSAKNLYRFYLKADPYVSGKK